LEFSIGLFLVACTSELASNIKPSLSPDVAPQETLQFTIALEFDAIPPIYVPVLVPATQASDLLVEDELIMGVVRDGVAKVYPVTVLHFRELVNDALAGILTLVTW
jgi:hypothetical protein